MLTRVLTVPELFDPFNFHALMSTEELEALYSSTNSSLPPLGPRTRNSLITMVVETAETVAG
jgi:hypothetical protein